MRHLQGHQGQPCKLCGETTYFSDGVCYRHDDRWGNRQGSSSYSFTSQPTITFDKRTAKKDDRGITIEEPA